MSRTKPDSSAGEIRWWAADLTDFSAVDRVFAEVQPDYVFHLGGIVTGLRDRKLVMELLQVNLVGTVHVLELSTQHRCQGVVLAGSLAESDTTTPGSPYSAAKSACALYAQMYFDLYGTPVVNARLFMVYGPGQRDTTKLVPYVSLALLRKAVPQLSSGVRPVDWIYVDDAIDGLIKCAVTPGVSGKVIDLGSGRLVTIREVTEELASIISPGAQLGFGARPDHPMEQVRQARVADTAGLIGWRAEMSLEEGLRRTVAFYARWADTGRASVSNLE